MTLTLLCIYCTASTSQHTQHMTLTLQCMYCGKTFLNGQFLLAHLERRHAEHRPFPLPVVVPRPVAPQPDQRDPEREKKVCFCCASPLVGYAAATTTIVSRCPIWKRFYA